MKYLNAQQLAFVLDIKKDDARAKMCNAWCKSKNIPNKAERILGGKIIDDYPQAMPIEMLSEQLNLPTLQEMVDDIEKNYLVRPASKKYILCDYPEKFLLKSATTGADKKIDLPAALKTMLPADVKERIVKEWQTRFPKIKIKQRI